MRAKYLLLIVFFFGISLYKAYSQGKMTISDAIEIALENNYGITIARNQLSISELNSHPGSAGMLPRIDATGSRNYQVNNTYQEYFDGRVRESDNAKSNSLNAGIQMNWTIFDGFYMFVRKNKLEELQKLDETQLRTKIENTLADVIITYHNIVIQYLLADLYQEAMSISSERKKFASAKLDVGSGSELSFLQASVDYNADSASWINQLMVVENSKADLNNMLSRSLSQDFTVENIIAVRLDLQYESILKRALEVNPELQSSRINLAIAALNIRESVSVRYPRLNFSTGYNFGRSVSEVGILQQNRNFGYYAGAGISLNIFDGFNSNRDIKMAKIRQETAQTLAEQTELNITARILKAHNDYSTNIRLINLERENLSLALKNFNIAEEKYKLGSLTDIELRETQNKMMDAEVRYFLAQFRGKVAETELLLLSGELSANL